MYRLEELFDFKLDLFVKTHIPRNKMFFRRLRWDITVYFLLSLIIKCFIRLFIFSKEQFQLRAVHRSSYAVRAGRNVFDVHYNMRSAEIV